MASSTWVWLLTKFTAWAERGVSADVVVHRFLPPGADSARKSAGRKEHVKQNSPPWIGPARRKGLEGRRIQQPNQQHVIGCDLPFI